MISFDEASALVDSVARPLGSENVPLTRAEGRVLAEPVIARISSPSTDVSAMDGYAVRTADIRPGPARLPVHGASFAGGGAPGKLPDSACMRIFTGAPLPLGADRVVIQEQVERDGELAVFAQDPTDETHVRKAGSDFPEGAMLLGKGTLLGPRQLVAAAAADCPELACVRRPRATLLATGDELVAPGHARDAAGAVPDSLSVGLAAFVARWGGDCIARHRLADDAEAARATAEAGVSAGDLVIVTGGASVGERDFAKAMFEPLGLETIFSKVAMKPGKPVWLGRCGRALVIGLPGNPTSAMVTARLLLAPLLAGLGGRQPGVARQWRPAVLAHALPATGDREGFLRARSSSPGLAEPLTNQQSHAQHALAQADLLIRRPRHAPSLGEGDEVRTLDF